MTVDTITHTAETFGWSRLAERLVRAWAGVRRRRRIAATVHALEALDDRTLKDIGVPRHSIRDVATGVADEPRRR